MQTNVMGTAVMLNAAKKAWELPDGTFKADKKFLHVSTDEVYGSLPDDDNAFSMRHHLSILIVHIRQARHPLICLLRHI